MNLLKDQVVVITGGAGRIGKVFAAAVAMQGGIAVVADIDINQANDVACTIRSMGPTCNSIGIEMDITSKQSLISVIDHLHSRYGKISALVNNAYPRNLHYGRAFFEVEYCDFCENISLHLGGYFLACQQFGEYFQKQGFGNIINIASIYGVIAPRFEIYEGTELTMPVEYAAIKSAVIHLTRYLAKMFRGKRIRVNAISPGGVSANQPDAFLERYGCLALNKGMLDPADLTGTLVFLLSEWSTQINGQNLIVDDGFTL